MSQSHYSLRWNNHQSHILSAFDALLQAETLVDVTLVCAESSVRAHKVVLSACSPFFQRIFAENPCKHPVIVLKDFSGWEVQAIVDFMYKGEISVVQEQLQSLIKAAESLQVRGLVNQDTPEDLPPEAAADAEEERSASASPMHADFEQLQQQQQRNGYFMLGGLSGASGRPEPLRAESPLPRRKQARPRRRSGEMMMTPQDLTTCPRVSSPAPSPDQPQQVVENLSVKKPKSEGGNKDCRDKENLMDEFKEKRAKMTFQGQFIQQSLLPLHQQQQLQHEDQEEERAKLLTPDPSGSPELDLSMHHKEFSPSHPPLLPPGMLSMKHELDHGHSPLPFPPMPSVSALTMTPPHIFGLDSPLLFPPGLDGCRNPLLELADPRGTPDQQMFPKKKMGRPKGQHSAPRGGPPRSWTNAELTEALQHVWNKKMTTSQASRIFGIPYNSLLMYVRGKYGKSLKLEQLRKDCIGGPGMDLVNLSHGSGAANNNNNTPSCKTEDHHRPSSAEQHQPQHPLFNPFAPNFYPDFTAGGIPIPVSMIHLLPQSEKNREHFLASVTHRESLLGAKRERDRGRESGSGAGSDLEDCNKNEHDDIYMPDRDRRELLQQNGQD